MSNNPHQRSEDKFSPTKIMLWVTMTSITIILGLISYIYMDNVAVTRQAIITMSENMKTVSNTQARLETIQTDFANTTTVKMNEMLTKITTNVNLTMSNEKRIYRNCLNQKKYWSSVQCD